MARVQRANVSGLVLPDEVSETILRGAAERSLVMQYGKTIPMQAQNKKLTEAEVSGANAFWVGEGARKDTDGPSMAQKTWTISAAEIAVIVPIDENVVDDANLDLFELYKPAIETAFAGKLDAAALFGTDVPTEWGTLGTNIALNAATASHEFELANTLTDEQHLDIISGTGAASADGLLQAVEDDGYEATGAVAYTRYKSRLRNLKDADNRYIFGDAVEAGVPGSLFGIPISFTGASVWPTGNDVPLMILGDWRQAVVGVRQGIRYKVFDQGVITDGAGNVVYSLMEQDMIALRVTARYGFKVIADDTADGETLAAGEPFPFSVLTTDADGL